MKVEISIDDVLQKFGRSAADLSDKARLEMSRGLHRGGEKMRTVVRKELRKQTSAKARAVTARTKSFLEDAGLTLVLQADGTPIPIQDFPWRFSKTRATLVRWSPREHWRLQDRSNRGRFGALVDDSKDRPGVLATMWGKRRGFKRSFEDGEGEPRMVREAGKQQTRKLFGPSLRKELLQGSTLDAFNRGARTVVQAEIEKRMVRLFAKGA